MGAGTMAKKYRSWIKVTGAREHNLKNISVEIPKEAFTVITGPSGSGKSSLALDILYTEGKRRYTESLSAYARQFLGVARKPDVDQIEGLCPAIAIEQKTVGANPRSTVGTITEIYDYLRVLFARVGVAHCPDCKNPVGAQSPESIAHHILALFKDKETIISAPIARQQKGEFKNDLKHHFEQGFYRFEIDGKQYKFSKPEEIDALKLGKTFKHTIDVLIDAFVIGDEERPRIQEAVEKAELLAGGLVKVVSGKKEQMYASQRMCLKCNNAFPELEPRFFSFNSPIGACKPCAGLGTISKWPWHKGDKNYWKTKYPDFFKKYATKLSCEGCYGKRLNPFALAVEVNNKNIHDVSEMPINEALEWFETIKMDATTKKIAKTLLNEITRRFQFLNDVGLPYLTLNRSARTLSGGEGQRIRLATQIGSALSGVLYILDEPSIGLHQRDNDRLIKTLKNLRDQGNTVVVVEHDTDTMMAADHLIDMGPAAGIHGGTITATGTPKEVAKNTNSLTGAYLSGKKKIELPEFRRKPYAYLILKHARKNNLKDLTVRFPLGVLCGVSGVSGSGKSSLVLEELVPEVHRALNGNRAPVVPTEDLVGADQINALVVIDQKPIGRSSRSNPATYLGIFDEIRNLFSALPESNARGYKTGRFSFNRPDGRCFECSGNGTITVEMHFLADVTITCKTCKGRRYNKETLQITYKRKNIADVLDMTALEAMEFFAAHQKIVKRLQLLCDVGLDYIKLAQSSTTLSGGEAQRIKLVDELAKRGTRTLYILDEPTTGLHSSDIEKLLMVLNRLVIKGNSVIVIEHNLDVLKTADYIIDMGPEGGAEGGTIVAEGEPKKVARSKKSKTAPYLRKALSESKK
jgi:excinuclease ABC subunit A